MMYLGTALSLGMLDMSEVTLKVEEQKFDWVRRTLKAEKWESCVEHADTALLLTKTLGMSVDTLPDFKLEFGDILIVAQYNGPRLPDGAVDLPEGAKIRWYSVDICDPDDDHVVDLR